MYRSEGGELVDFGILVSALCGFVALGVGGVDLPEPGNKQVLVDTFRNLVRYALRKTGRNASTFGVTPDTFSIEAMDKSLASGSNAAISGGNSSLSMTELLAKAHGPFLTFRFYWEAPAGVNSFTAAFGLSYEPDGDLAVRLLWLALPEQIPISRRVGVVDARRPLEEAVMELLRFDEGRLVPYPPPE
jgi:hypothetical protein